MNPTLPSAAQETSPELGRRMADCIRVLAADAVQRANSGHPGAPLGMAEMATALWTRHLKHQPDDPQWPDRDRFVLSNGHASMLLYALLHLSGYDLNADDLRAFRQLHSRTPGHPEVGVTPGVETTTGPLGQGLANAVGMALAEALLAAEFNVPDSADGGAGHRIVDHRTWVMLGDGCLMEGISQEALSLAGTWRLRKLIALYDDNGISIDGQVAGWFADDTAQRCRASGWQVIGPLDGHDLAALDQALQQACAYAQQADAGPTLIICRTTIGRGAGPQLEGTADVHGAPLGEAGVAALRQRLDWSAAPFEVPDALRAAWDAREAGAARRRDWDARMARYAEDHPERAAEFRRRSVAALPADWAARSSAALQALLAAQTKPLATRRASQLVLDALAPLLPELLGGSADLTGSNLTDFQGHRTVTPQRLQGNYLSWGVREFGMAAALNGVALHRGWLPYGGTFLTFSDYSRNAIRMAALMRQRVVHVFTHDSIGLGEDGPTHQPVEHVAALRLIPGLDVWRPADLAETAVAWQQALSRGDDGRDDAGPSALVLSRQALPPLAQAVPAETIARGGYVLAEAAGGAPQAVLLGTGSELQLAVAAQALLAAQGLAVRVVSMPCTRRFEAQPAEWQAQVLPPQLPLVVVEAGHPDGWQRWTGKAGQGTVIGMRRFGESAPGATLMQHFGFTAQAVADAVQRLLSAPPAGAAQA